MTGATTLAQPAYGSTPGLSAAVAIADHGLREQTLRALRAAGVTVLGDFSALASTGDLSSAIGRVQPAILFLGFAGLPLDPIETVRRIRELEGAPKVVVVNASADPETILKAMRAGASEFLYPPLEGALAEALSQAAAEYAREGTRRGPGGRILAFLSAKGGCGATSIACHAAGYLRRKFKKQVLLADLDFAAGNAGLLMGAGQRYHIVDALDHLDRLDSTLWKSFAAATTAGPDFIAAPPEPTAIAERVEPLAALMRFWRSQYDYTIADLGHGLTPATCALLASVDSVTLIATAEMPALRLAKQAIAAISRLDFSPNRLQLVINRMPRRAPIQLPELEKIMGFPIYAVVPNEYQALEDAYAESRLLDPDSTLGAPLAALAAKLTGAPPEPRKARRLAFFS